MVHKTDIRVLLLYLLLHLLKPPDQHVLGELLRFENKLHRKSGSDIKLTFHRDGTAHLLDHSFADTETKACTLSIDFGVLVQLAEVHEKFG